MVFFSGLQNIRIHESWFFRVRVLAEKGFGFLVPDEPVDCIRAEVIGQGGVWVRATSMAQADGGIDRRRGDYGEGEPRGEPISG